MRAPIAWKVPTHMPVGISPTQLRDPLPHLARGLVRERHRENVRRIHAVVLDQSSDARREHPRLPRAGAGEHENRTFEVEHGLALRGIQPGECVFGHIGDGGATHP